jgi:hypothetical protein
MAPARKQQVEVFVMILSNEALNISTQKIIIQKLYTYLQYLAPPNDAVYHSKLGSQTDR